MRIALGFFGFTRVTLNKQSVDKVLRLLPSNSEIDIYVVIPDRYSEFDETRINIDDFRHHIHTAFNHSCVKSINVNLFNYDISAIIRKTKQIGLPFMSEHNIISYRLVSLINSITQLCKYIKQSDRVYDSYILTRFDMFDSITSFGSCIENTKPNNVHIWRTVPYADNTHAEDRIIISSAEGINVLADYYDNLSSELNSCSGSHEYMLCGYLNMFESLEKLPQTGINIGLSPFRNVKYDANFISKCRELWDQEGVEKIEVLLTT